MLTTKLVIQESIPNQAINSAPCVNPYVKLAEPASPSNTLLSNFNNQPLAYVLSPPAIAAVQEPCTGKIHHLPVYPIQIKNSGSVFFRPTVNSDVSSVLLPVMESAAKNIVNYLNAAQSSMNTPKASQPQILTLAPHIPQKETPEKSVLNPKLAVSYAEMLHKAFHKLAVGT